MAEISGGRVCRGYIDRYPHKVESAANIALRRARVNEILGTDIDGAEIVDILESLEMTIRAEKDGFYRVTPPTYRVDIVREIDLIEEVARLYGYDRIPATLPSVSVTAVTRDHQQIVVDRIRDLIRGSGYSEIITFSFISPESAKLLGIRENDDRLNMVKIRNPLTEDQAVMRTTLVGSLLETMKKNSHNGCLDLKLFEIGRVFFHRKEGELPAEKSRMGCLITGMFYDDLWCSKIYADFYDLKGCIENIFDGLKIAGLEFRSDQVEAFLHPGKSCGIYAEDRLIGFLGEVHPDILLKMDLKNRAYVAEIDLDIVSTMFSDEVLYKDLPRFPSVVRDVAFVIGQEMEADKMLKLAVEMDKVLLEKVSIFDVYTGKNIPQGKKSLGIRFVYRASDRTLTDDEVSLLHGNIVTKIVELTGARIRGEEN
jgi:phenylalanyl-tRNA synthetase beta chain